MRQAEAGHTGREVKARPCVQAAGRRTDRQTDRQKGGDMGHTCAL